MMAGSSGAEMLLWLLFAAGAIIGFAEFIISRLEVLFLEAELARLKALFEGWWLETVYMPRKRLSLVLARLFLRLLHKLLGPSKRGLRRCLLLSTALLTPALLLVLAASPDSVSLPWKNFDTSMKVIRELADQPAGDDVKPYFEEIAAVAAGFDTKGWRIVFSVLYISAFWYVTGRCFWWSSRLARRFLHEIIKSGRALSVLALGVAQFIFSVAVGTFWMFVLGTVGNPALLSLPLLGVILAALSLWTLIPVVMSYGYLTWLLTGAGLKLVCLVGLFPLWCTFLITLTTSALLRFRRAFTWLCLRLLLTCAQRGPIPVAITVLAGAAGIIALVANLLSK